MLKILYNLFIIYTHNDTSKPLFINAARTKEFAAIPASKDCQCEPCGVEGLPSFCIAGTSSYCGFNDKHWGSANGYLVVFESKNGFISYSLLLFWIHDCYIVSCLRILPARCPSLLFQLPCAYFFSLLSEYFLTRCIRCNTFYRIH